jgi:hypothetical protein
VFLPPSHLLSLVPHPAHPALVVLPRLLPLRPARLPRLPLVLPATTSPLSVVFSVPSSASLPSFKQLNPHTYHYYYNQKMSVNIKLRKEEEEEFSFHELLRLYIMPQHNFL